MSDAPERDRTPQVTAERTIDIPLFPLGAVLFPGGDLSLRIFEQRYLNMIRDCARDASGFGVCLILRGGETHDTAMPAAVGTLAHIIDFYTLSDGLLGIRATGGVRFRVAKSRVRDDGLISATVQPCAETPRIELPPEFVLLATILERLLEKMDSEYAQAPRANFDDAQWVGFRLAEALPIDQRERQHLLQLDDPLARLRQLLHYLPRFQTH